LTPDGQGTVVIITDGLFAGGTERQIVELLRGLRLSGCYRTALAVLDRDGELEPAGRAAADRFLPIRRARRVDPLVVPALVRQARGANVGLIHVFGWMSSLAGLIAARWLRVPIVNGSIRSAPPRLGRREQIGGWCAARSDAVVANSRAGLRAYGLAAHLRAVVIPNGIDFTRFEGVVATPTAEPTVCMVANFSEYKDHTSVIEAMARVRQQVPDARLVLVGHDIGTLAASQRLVAERGLAGSVTFVTDTDDPLPYVAGSDVCVLASTLNEGISNAILEYMALSKPVVATAGGGTAEVVVNGETGILVPSHAPAALADQVVALLTSPARAVQLGQAGRHRVVRAFSREHMVQAYETLYGRLGVSNIAHPG
jgi:glycosyltransferase involved in cell wall biosynthesis